MFGTKVTMQQPQSPQPPIQSQSQSGLQPEPSNESAPLSSKSSINAPSPSFASSSTSPNSQPYSSGTSTTSPPAVSAARTNQARSIDVRQSNPIPLTASQEAEVRDLYYKRVRVKCAAEIKAFAQCSTGRTFSISWTCRPQRLAMNTCMNSHAGREEEDRAREEWFAKLPERQRQKEEEERWKEDQRRKKREWWELDENGRRTQK